MKSSSWPWLGLAAFVAVADQVTKYLAQTSLDYGIPMLVFPGFNLTLLFNRGAAFSFLHDANGWQRWLFVALAFVISSVIVALIVRIKDRQRWLPAALSLILGGAIGNVIDRLLWGHVIDFIQVYYGNWHFPAFNLADSAITCGAVMLLLHRPRAEAEASAELE